MQPNIFQCNVKSIAPLCDNVFSIILSTNGDFPNFIAGQYLDFILPNGDRRSYSIASTPDTLDQVELNIGPVNKSYGSSVLQHIQNTKNIDIEFPKGNCYLDLDSLPEVKPILLIAGGTGFGQIASIVRSLLNNPPLNSICIYWGVSHFSSFYNLELLDKWQQENSNMTFIPVVSPEGNSSEWEGRTGLLPDVIFEDFSSLKEFEVIASGPVPMIEALLSRCESRGLNRNNLKSDVFEYAL
jgi:CDP-4-dehydro-6-deoxyglucose reductase